jgi:predicted DNA-binding protein
MTKMLTIRLPLALHRRLRRRCVDHDEPVAEFIRRVIIAALDDEEITEAKKR